MSSADAQYEAQNDVTGGDVPAGDSMDNDYASRTGQSHIPVLKDDKPIEDGIDPAVADSDEQLRMLALFTACSPTFLIVCSIEACGSMLCNVSLGSLADF